MGESPKFAFWLFPQPPAHHPRPFSVNSIPHIFSKPQFNQSNSLIFCSLLSFPHYFPFFFFFLFQQPPTAAQPLPLHLQECKITFAGDKFWPPMGSPENSNWVFDYSLIEDLPVPGGDLPALDPPNFSCWPSHSFTPPTTTIRCLHFLWIFSFIGFSWSEWVIRLYSNLNYLLLTCMRISHFSFGSVEYFKLI